MTISTDVTRAWEVASAPPYMEKNVPGRRHETLAFLGQCASSSKLMTMGAWTQPAAGRSPSFYSRKDAKSPTAGRQFLFAELIILSSTKNKSLESRACRKFLWQLCRCFMMLLRLSTWIRQRTRGVVLHISFVNNPDNWQSCQQKDIMCSLCDKRKREQTRRSCLPLKEKIQAKLHQHHLGFIRHSKPMKNKIVKI